MNLPADYLAYLENPKNALEGSRTSFPLSVVLWPREEAELAQQELEVFTYAPGFQVFGGDGGGEVLAFDSAGAVYVLPMVGMSPDDAIKLSDSWAEFILQVTPEPT